MSYWVVKCEEHDPYFYLSAPGEGSCWARTAREARAFVRKLDAQRAIDMTPGLGSKARPVHVLTRRDVHRREVKRLRVILKNAHELAVEGWSYADHYFRTKWQADRRLEELAAVLSESAEPK